MSDQEIDIFGPAPSKLSRSGYEERIEVFCLEYVKDHNGARSARVAGYSPDSAREQASVLLTKPNVRARINELMEEIVREKKDGAKEVHDRLYDMAHTDILDIFEQNPNGRLVVRKLQDIPKSVRLNIASFKEVYDKDSEEWCLHVTLTKKEKALELLGKYHKMFVERFEHSGNIGFSDIASKIPDDILGDRKK